MINVKHNELFEKSFNGIDLDGWAQPGAIESKTSQNSELRCG